LNHKILKTEEYLCLKDKGIDIKACLIDFALISVSCEDLSLYRKALRVKIRALMKLDDVHKLKCYMNALYTLALFAKYLYGFHSCTSTQLYKDQEEGALRLQGDFDASKVENYDGKSWITYETSVLDTQDQKPFLSLKDKAHFEKYFTNE